MGRALGPRLGQNVSRYLRMRPPRPGAIDAERLHREALPWLRTLPARFQEEMEGLAEGADLPIERLAEWSYVECCIAEGCSGLAIRLGGETWVARNNDMFVPDAWGYVSIRALAGRIPTLSFGLEGDVFTTTGLNRERLWLHHQAIPCPDGPRPGRLHLPSFVVLTDLLETCSTLKQVEARLGEVDRDDGMLLFAVEGLSGEFAVLECASSSHLRRSGEGRFLVATNHAAGPGWPAPGGDSLARQERLSALAEALYARGTFAALPRDLIAILADPGVERRGPDMPTVYANACCPRSGETWFTFGGYPAASRGAWARLDWPF